MARVSDPAPTGPEARRPRSRGPVVAAAVWVLGSAVAFVVLHPLVAAFVCIVGLTVVAMSFLSSDWVPSTSFEEREAVRARRRKAAWEAGAAARARDRVRWEAFQARRADRSEPADG